MKFKGIFVCLLALTACSKFGSVGYMPEAYNASQPAMEADDAPTLCALLRDGRIAKELSEKN